ncbi:hypothetical protein [Exiguobacterium sp. R-39]|uniref:hypothetical protein n=1 Tax=Exiguobacterium sp. R-39 TaxID=3416708 RepID=UPI003CF4548E
MSKTAQGSQKTVKIGEEQKEFVLQHPGVREGVKIRDRAKNMNGQIVEEKLYDEYMKYVIVEPRVTWDSVEELGNSDFNDLMKAAGEFLMG